MLKTDFSPENGAAPKKEVYKIDPASNVLHASVFCSLRDVRVEALTPTNLISLS